MSEVSLKKPVAIPRGALRIVLFGMPDAGKSSLLGALAQASQTQELALHGKLVDKSQGLTELQRRLYENAPKPTLEEVAPFPIELDPFPVEDGGRAPPPLDAVLIDCDGRLANEYLSRQRSLDDAGSALGKAVFDADTLLLVVDTSSSQEVIRRDFAQFGRFLRLLEEHRGQRAEVGGLPVYLVLTKCDLLARKNDTAVTWMERIEEYKRTVDRKFREYLAQQGSGESNTFGKVDLHLWATAIKRPAVGETPARPREPYGVAELFRQALDSASDYRAHQAKESRKLRLAVTGVSGLLGLLVLLGLFFWASRESPEVRHLSDTIDRFRSAHSTPAERFAEPLDKTIQELEDFEHDPVFPDIAPDKKDYVEECVKELQAYQKYRKDLLEEVQPPEFVRNDAELQKMLDTLARLQPPEQYAADWSETKVGKLREQWLHNAKVLEREVNQARDKLRSLVNTVRQLRTEDSRRVLKRKAAELLKEVQTLPYREDNRKKALPGSWGGALTYDNVLEFDRVRALYEEWKEAQPQLAVWEKG